MDSVFAVVLAGGSGTRFWPASRRLKPKQLLALGPGTEALIAQTVERLNAVCPPENLVVATGRHVLAQTQHVLPQLPGSAFLAEPCPKNTAPCIGWATERITRRCPEARIVVVPSDQHIAQVPAYHEALRTALEAAKGGSIVTLGIEPTRPETGYGYIEAGESQPAGVRRVARFVEKPDRATAERYLAEGRYYWNAGMFVYSGQSMLAEMRRQMPELHAGLMRVRAAAEQGAEQEAAEVERLFAETESVSIDYGVMENAEDILVVPADVGWSDLGSFQVAWELSEKDSRGNVAPDNAVLQDASGNLLLDLRSQQGKGPSTASLIGIKDMCVIWTDDALLVVPRDRCQDVRDVVSILKSRGMESLI